MRVVQALVALVMLLAVTTAAMREQPGTAPLWVDVTTKVRSFSVSRGRENELGEVDAGTATIVLDNRTRTFDPVVSTGIRPMNRWWIREQFTGETQSIFLGYAESYDQAWVQPNEATTVVNCADEMKVLALYGLPITSPARNSYSEVVASDLPAGYWKLNDNPEIRIQAPVTVDNDSVSPNPATSTPGGWAPPPRWLSPHIGDPYS